MSQEEKVEGQSDMRPVGFIWKNYSRRESVDHDVSHSWATGDVGSIVSVRSLLNVDCLAFTSAGYFFGSALEPLWLVLPR